MKILTFWSKFFITVILSCWFVLGPTEAEANVSSCEAACYRQAARDVAKCGVQALFLGPAAEAYFLACSLEAAYDCVGCLSDCGTFGSGGIAYNPVVTPESQFLYTPGQLLWFEAARHDTSDYMAGQGTVQSVNYYLLDRALMPGDSLPDTTAYLDNPWILAGSGTYNVQKSAWHTTLNMANYTSPQGYLVRIDFNDTSALNGVVIGHSIILPAGLVTGVETGSHAGALNFRVGPNPSSSPTRLSFTTTSAGPVSLSLYDIAGRQLRTWNWSTLSVGHHGVTWDGLDQRGQKVANGVIFGRLQVAGKKIVQRIILVH